MELFGQFCSILGQQDGIMKHELAERVEDTCSALKMLLPRSVPFQPKPWGRCTEMPSSELPETNNAARQQLISRFALRCDYLRGFDENTHSTIAIANELELVEVTLQVLRYTP
jgi:hypothetical protein